MDVVDGLFGEGFWRFGPSPIGAALFLCFFGGAFEVSASDSNDVGGSEIRGLFQEDRECWHCVCFHVFCVCLVCGWFLGRGLPAEYEADGGVVGRLEPDGAVGWCFCFALMNEFRRVDSECFGGMLERVSFLFEGELGIVGEGFECISACERRGHKR